MLGSISIFLTANDLNFFSLQVNNIIYKAASKNNIIISWQVLDKLMSKNLI